MKYGFYTAFLLLIISVRGASQNEAPTLKSEAVSAVVWDETLSSPSSSEFTDPVTGTSVRSLNHNGIEVHSRSGYRILRSGQAGELLTFVATVANNTDSEVVLARAGLVVDGHLLLELVPETALGIKAEPENAHCTEPIAVSVNSFPKSRAKAKPVSIPRNTASTFRFTVKDPRNYSLLCSIKGCYPRGELRFYLTLNSTDYVFPWAGQELVNCSR